MSRDREWLAPYLRALRAAIIRPAPPWPRGAEQYRQANGDILGWYDGPTDDGAPRIYLALRDPKHRVPAELVHTLTEEICHHCRNDLTHGAVAPLVRRLLRSAVWRDAAQDRLLALLLRKRPRKEHILPPE